VSHQFPRGYWPCRFNPSGSYVYSSRSPNVVFGGRASWASLLKFEDTLDGGAQVYNDGTYGWCAAPDVRTKWMQVPKVAIYPEFLWSQSDTEIDGSRRETSREHVANARRKSDFWPLE
jgi:hypothetical protein